MPTAFVFQGIDFYAIIFDDEIFPRLPGYFRTCRQRRVAVNGELFAAAV